MEDRTAKTTASQSPVHDGPDGSLLRAVNVVLHRRRQIVASGVVAAIIAVALGRLVPSPPPPVVATFRAPARVALGLSDDVRRLAESGDVEMEGVGRRDPVVRITQVTEPDVWRMAIVTADPERSTNLALRALEDASRAAAEGSRPVWLDDAWQSLRAAEAELERFVEENPEYEESAESAGEFERLLGRIDLRRSLVYDAERALLGERVAAGEDGDGFVVVSAPSIDRGNETPYLLALGLVIGLLLATVWAFARDGIGRYGRRHPGALEEFESLLNDAKNDLLRPWRMFRR